LQKCERILRQFCVEGLPTEEATGDGKKKRKVYRKVPPKVIQEAKGIVIFTAFRSGFAPFAGAGGGGVVMVRQKDNSWSAPSFISPNNFSAGLMIGLDVYNAILLLRSDAAVEGFRTHHFTIGSEIAVAAGPLGYGVSAETGVKNRTPIYSYVLSKGFYAGVEMVGQVFIDRFDENERVYHWPGIKAGDIFDGKVRRPVEADKLYQALHDAEAGIAQGSSLEWDTDEVKALDLAEGEVLRLPPTPDQLSMYESIGIQDEEDLRLEREEREAVRALPPPPKHPHVKNYKYRSTSGKSVRSLPPSPNFGASSSTSALGTAEKRSASLDNDAGPDTSLNSAHTDSGLFPTSHGAAAYGADANETSYEQDSSLHQPTPRRPVPALPMLAGMTSTDGQAPPVVITSTIDELGFGSQVPPAHVAQNEADVGLSEGLQDVSLDESAYKDKARAEDGGDLGREAEYEEQHQQQYREVSLSAPPLVHQDSASSESVYEEPEREQGQEETIPPAYNDSSAVEVKEKEGEQNPEASRDTVAARDGEHEHHHQ